MLLQERHPLFVAKACGYLSRTVDWLRFSVHLLSLRCPRPIRSRPPAASWDSSIYHRRYGSQASTSSPSCGYGRWWERKGRLLRRSLASSQNRDVEIADIASSQAATLDVHGAYGTARPSGKDGRS